MPQLAAVHAQDLAILESCFASDIGRGISRWGQVVKALGCTSLQALSPLDMSGNRAALAASVDAWMQQRRTFASSAEYYSS